MTSTSATNFRYKYDVFLSFRGKDTRSTFTDHLYHALKLKGISTFLDDTYLPSAVHDYIAERSRIVVPVLGTEYISAEDCLDGLERTLKRKNAVVLPVFYDIDPKDVRYQTGSFAEAFIKHEQRCTPEKVRRWRDALQQVASLSGWHSKGRYEPELIDDIVEDIRARLDNPGSSILSGLKLAAPSSRRQRQRKCQVFMSFRGIDTRLKFAAHLHDALVREGISTFRDDKNLRRGETIASQLVEAIEGSQICIVILSPNFASSTWCLNELVKILECRKASTWQKQEKLNSEGVHRENKHKANKRKGSSRTVENTSTYYSRDRMKPSKYRGPTLEALFNLEGKIKAWPS